jgi:hypothetical protein
MKYNQWTLALAAAGVVTLAPAVQAEEAQHQVVTALTSTTLSGYVDTSAIWKFGTDRGGSVLPGRSYDGPDKQDGFNLNVVKLSLEKPLEEGNWSAGYKVDLLFGPDANTYNTSSIGLGTSDFAVKQAYVNLQVPLGNGLDFKMGVWDTVLGYEVFEAGNNPNYSRSYGYFLEPKTHTGILASYRVNNVIGLSVGVADSTGFGNGYLNAINSRSDIESRKSYLGSLTLTAPESTGFLKGSALYAGIIDNSQATPIGGQARNLLNNLGNLAGGAGLSGLSNLGGVGNLLNPVGKTDVINYYVGATVNTPVQGLALGAAYDYRGNSHNDSLWSAAYANAIALYGSYQATDKLKVNVRGEYATASAGTWTVDKAGTGKGEKFFGLTVTTDYSLWANVISRLEFRWDRDVSGGPGAFGGMGTTTVASGETGGTGITLPTITTEREHMRNALSLALNVIYKF